jgi:hypothetical protein
MNLKDKKLLSKVYNVLYDYNSIEILNKIDLNNIDIYKNKEYLYLIININEILLCKYNFNELLWSLKTIKFIFFNINKNIFKEFKKLNLLAEICSLENTSNKGV